MRVTYTYSLKRRRRPETLPALIRVRVKTSFGEVAVEGNSTKEVLEVLEGLSPEFIEKVGSAVASKLTPPVRAQLEGLVEFTTEGPVITARAKLTHYEAIGLVLYASEGRTASGALVERLLQSSGVRSMVPARMNEMTKRGLVFKPDPVRPEIRLTVAGEKWVEDEVVARLRNKAGG
ncbi:MAG: hypothetical protein WCC63_00460 [Candidatus Bathyarchaeia archaeon]